MQCRTMSLLFLFFILLRPLSSANQEEAEKILLEVVVDRSLCSATCGLGVMTETVCLLRDGRSALEEEVSGEDGAQVSEECRVRKVSCLQPWQCGLRTLTVTSGQRVRMDCLGERMRKFSWRVSWRLARGIISSDDSLFAQWDAPQLDQVVLDPVTEKDAGTYRCDVQDASYRRVKRVYWGIRVMPVGALYKNDTSPDQPVSAEKLGRILRIVFYMLLWFTAALVLITLLFLT